jgi:hypothetical protein
MRNHFRNDKAPGPAIVADRQQGRLAPFRAVRLAVEQHAGKGIVAIGEEVGADDHFLAHGALDGKAAAVNLGLDALNDHTGRKMRGQRLHG